MLCMTSNSKPSNFVFIESEEKNANKHSITIECEVRAEKKKYKFAKFIDEVPFVNAEHELF